MTMPIDYTSVKETKTSDDDDNSFSGNASTAIVDVSALSSS